MCEINDLFLLCILCSFFWLRIAHLDKKTLGNLQLLFGVLFRDGQL